MVPSIGLSQSAKDLSSAYDAARRIGFVKVHEDYATALLAIQKARLQAQDLAGANAVAEEIKQVRARMAKLTDGADPPVPGLNLAGERSAAQDATATETSKSVQPAQQEFLARLRRGISGINESYHAKAVAAQKQFMAEADLESANALEELKTRLKPESASTEEDLPGDDLLDAKHRRYWIEDRGSWTFKDGKLIGDGNSRIDYKRTVRSPFTLQFDMRVIEGMRPRIYLGRYTIANEGYVHQLLLKPEDQQNRIPYKLGEKYRIRFVADPRFVEFYIDDKLIERREKGLVKPLSMIGFAGGDGYSLGVTEYSNIRLDQLILPRPQ